ncbi:MAG: class I SAM-dependent methyltransferase [Chitinophagales bacterium]|nr:class I SAM-dependent methyltransferase [Chitinophagales bacterium]
MTRKRFQGVLNIISFNRYSFISFLLFIAILFLVKPFLPELLKIIVSYIIIGSFLATMLSILISTYIYDLSGLYQFDWFTDVDKRLNLVNIHAGFDESSEVIIEKYTNSTLAVLDFYDPLLHTELSIKIARKAYPAYPGTKRIRTNSIPIPSGSIDKVFIIFSAHEIRNDAERIIFFKEVKRILKPEGSIFVLEHLRDFNNFIAYNIGFLHFLSSRTWKNTFCKANLSIYRVEKINPLISLFILQPTYGNTA